MKLMYPILDAHDFTAHQELDTLCEKRMTILLKYIGKRFELL